MEDTLKLLLNEMQTMNKRLDSLDKSQEGINKRLDSLDKNQEGINKRLDSLDKSQEGINKRLDSLDKSQEGITKRLDSIDKVQQEGFAKINKKLDTIYSQVAHNTEQEIKINEHDEFISKLKKVVSN